MRVLHVYKDYHPVLGGIENHVRLLAEGQARRGLDVTVLVTGASSRTEVTRESGVRVIRAGRLARVASTPLSLAFFAQMRKCRVDVAHLHFPYPPGEVGNLLLRPGRRTVITYHSDVVRQQRILRLYDPLLRRILRRADGIIATSAPYVESSPYLRPIAGHCTVVPLGIEVERFSRPDPRAGSLRQGAGSGPGPLTVPSGPAASANATSRNRRPRLLFVGRLRYYKGLEHLLEALSGVDATLWVIGDGPMSAEWRALASHLRLADRVHFLGEVPDNDLPAFFQAADVVVLPASYRSEAFGLVQLEAMASGTPVLSTELGTGTSFVNQDGVTGLVIPPRDVHALAAAIERLLAEPELRREMGERGRKRVLEHFTVEAMVDGILDVYRSVLRAPDGPG